MRGILAVTLALVSIGNLQAALFIIQNSYFPWDVLSGKETRETYRMYTHPGLNPYPSNVMYRWMEKNISPKTRTLMIGESKTFDLKLPYLYTDVHGQNLLIRWSEESNSPEELLKKFQDAGVTHVLINFQEARRTYGYKMLKWNEKSLNNFDAFWNLYSREIHRVMIPERFFRSESPVLLYEISSQKIDRSKDKTLFFTNPLTILEKMNKK